MMSDVVDIYRITTPTTTTHESRTYSPFGDIYSFIIHDRSINVQRLFTIDSRGNEILLLLTSSPPLPPQEQCYVEMTYLKFEKL